MGRFARIWSRVLLTISKSAKFTMCTTLCADLLLCCIGRSLHDLQCPVLQAVKNVFDMSDVNQNGFISMEELPKCIDLLSQNRILKTFAGDIFGELQSITV